MICASHPTTVMLAASQLLMPVAIAVPSVTKPTVKAASIFVVAHMATRTGSLILFQLCPNHLCVSPISVVLNPPQISHTE